MSSAQATFFLPDGTVAGYGIYYGTADQLLGFVADTPEGAWEAKAGVNYPRSHLRQPPDPSSS